MTPFLTIAIPTYNRAGVLDKALSNLIPQILGLKNIELIISDNFSTDNTKEVISKWKSEYPKLVQVYFQKENTGFYGNFKKCKELAIGKYIWLLSDDDHLLPGSLNKIYSILEKEHPDILHLENKVESDKVIKRDCSFEGLISEKNFKLTLITASIFRNDYADDELLDKFVGNSFPGFILLISTKAKAKKGIIVSNIFFARRKAKPGGYNFYQAFVVEMEDILDYMLSEGFSRKQVDTIKKNILIKLVLKRVLYQKMKGHLDGTLQTYSFAKIYQLLSKYYKNYILYWILIFPFFGLPNFYKIKGEKK